MDITLAFRSIQDLMDYANSTMADKNPALAKATVQMLHTIHTAVFDAQYPEYSATSNKEKAV